MAKRFSETDKWQDEWFSELKPFNKLIFLFLVDRCDNAGFFEINARLSSFLIGITIEQFEQGLAGLNKCLIKSNDGKKIWLKNFIQHQKNLPLNPINNAHKQIIFLLNSNKDNFDFDFKNLGANEGLISPLGKGNDKGNDKDIVIDNKEEIEIFKIDEKLIFPNAENLDIVLPSNELFNCKVLISNLTIPKVFSKDEDIRGLWTVFKAIRFNGQNQYYGWNKVYEHFKNDIKSQIQTKKIYKDGKTVNGNNDETKLGTSEARVAALKKW